MLPDDLPLGYHRVYLRSGDDESSAAVIVTPAWLGVPERLGARRTWGLATQLYSVRSRQSWGVGDLTDLVDLAVWSASVHGAGYVLVNPLHAAEPTSPMEPSPYLPTSRRFVNPLYLRVEAIPEFAELPKRGRVRRLRDGVQKHAASLDSIDRDSAWAAKREALELVYRCPAHGRPRTGLCGVPRSRGCGARRLRHLVCAGREVRRRLASSGPSRCGIPALTASPKFVEKHSAAVDFHRWLQWQLDEQLAAAQTQAVSAGMSLGIVHDLAVGVHPERGRFLGACRTRWPSAFRPARRRTSSTSWVRTGRSRRGDRIAWKSWSISRSAP